MLDVDRAEGTAHSVQIGLLPNTQWLAGALELNGQGEIVVDDAGRTSLPGVFAAGDCTDSAFKQIVVALAQEPPRR